MVASPVPDVFVSVVPEVVAPSVPVQTSTVFAAIVLFTVKVLPLLVYVAPTVAFAELTVKAKYVPLRLIVAML